MTARLTLILSSLFMGCQSTPTFQETPQELPAHWIERTYHIYHDVKSPDELIAEVDFDHYCTLCANRMYLYKMVRVTARDWKYQSTLAENNGHIASTTGWIKFYRCKKNHEIATE